MKCSCGETNPHKFYKSVTYKCKNCVKRAQRKYDTSEKGKAVKKAYMETTKGRKVTKKKHRNYDNSVKGIIRRRNYLKNNTVTRETLKEQVFPECENCNENIDGNGSISCSIANGDEDIKLCPIWINWKHYGEHPNDAMKEFYDEQEYYMNHE